MSESEHRQHDSELCSEGNREEDDDEEEDKEREDGGEGDERRREVQRKGVFGISRGFRNAIKRRFRTTRKRRKEDKEKEKERGDDEVFSSPSAGRRGRRRRSQCGGLGSSVGCYVCFMRPRTDESPETPTSDPNSESFSFEMLRALIESNDFYCKECNPHI